jgi:hypothetical protein
VAGTFFPAAIATKRFVAVSLDVYIRWLCRFGHLVTAATEPAHDVLESRGRDLQDRSFK